MLTSDFIGTWSLGGIALYFWHFPLLLFLFWVLLVYKLILILWVIKSRLIGYVFKLISLLLWLALRCASPFLLLLSLLKGIYHHVAHLDFILFLGLHHFAVELRVDLVSSPHIALAVVVKYFLSIAFYNLLCVSALLRQQVVRLALGYI